MNYHQHFGLREAPFSITPDTSFFYACRSIQEALNTLLIAVANGEGFIKITGEVGTGKTLLCRKFLATLHAGWASAYLPNPSLEPRALVHRQLADRLALEADFAFVRPYNPHDHVERRRLAGAVWPEQADNLPRRHVHRDAIDHAPAAVFLGQLGGGKQRVVGGGFHFRKVSWAPRSFGSRAFRGKSSWAR